MKHRVQQPGNVFLLNEKRKQLPASWSTKASTRRPQNFLARNFARDPETQCFHIKRHKEVGVCELFGEEIMQEATVITLVTFTAAGTFP